MELNVRIGTIYHRLGENVLARKVLEKAVRLNRKSGSAHAVLAEVYSDLRLYTAAMRTANTALRLHSSADNRLLLESIKSDRDDYLKNKKLGPSLVIDKLALTPVYSTALAEEKISIGSVTIANRGKRDVDDISLRVYIGDFVDAGMMISMPVIKANASVEIPLEISLYSHIDEFAEDQVKSVDVELGFSDQHGSRLVQKQGILSIFGQHAVDWSSVRSLSHFLQARNGSDRIEPSGAQNDSYSPVISPVYLSPLIVFYSEIAGQGIVIKRHPESEKYYLQYPSETLVRHQGSYADIALLFASFLESGGNRVVLAGSIERPLLLVDSGITWDQRARLGLQDSVIYHHSENVWIPLAVGEWANGINAMWSTGLRLISGLKEKPMLIEFESGPGPLSNGKRPSHVVSEPDPAWARWFRQRQFYALQPYLMANSAPGIESGSQLQQAQWYLRNKYYRHALKTFSAALEENPYSYDATLGAGEAQVGLGALSDALDFYQRAAYLEPYDKVSTDKELQLRKQFPMKSTVDNTAGKLVH